MQFKRKALSLLLCVACVAGLAGCSGGAANTNANTESKTQQSAAEGESKSGSGTITVGFSQVGAESDWRTANSKSMKSTFTEANGYKLIFDDAQQKQENQITAIRNFIQQDVDYILLAPVTETGWDTVLKEAKDAGIPVIIVDRMVNVKDDSLYTAWVGSNFRAEGDKAVAWLDSFLKAKGRDKDTINIVDIQGTIGASAQIGRTAALEDGVKNHSNWKMAAQQTGEFTQAKGQEVMESVLKQNSNIDVVYCENDNEAFGAIDAIKAAGKKVGTEKGEIMVLSFDSTNAGLKKVQSGEITLDTECNPLHGPRVNEIIEKLKNKQDVDKKQYVDEKMFSHDDTVKSVTISAGTFEPTVVTDDVIKGRAY